jgi:undecaprenyl-diphosphatase
MEFDNVVLLSITQGITELLPISSSAHLILVSQLIDIDIDTFLLATLHLGTTIAILMFFSDTLFKNIKNRRTLLLYTKILVSSIPAAIFGYFFQEQIENSLRGLFIIAMSLIIWGIFMILVERKITNKESSIHSVTWKQSIVMGISQIIALIPGTSRSGVTTLAGIVMGLNKYTALQYTFILGLPILLGVSFYEMSRYPISRTLDSTNILGITVSAIFAYITLLVLRKISKDRWLSIFGYYRIILGGIILLTISL